MSKQRRRRNRSENKTTRLTAQRHLLAERLEDRLLLAANVNPWHNVFVATDVDGNYSTTPMDALWIINDLNDNGARELDIQANALEPRPFYDTNNDGNVSAIDALQVINRLNSGEGEPGDWVAFRLEAQDLNGNPLANNTVNVGDEFRLQLYTQDLGGNNSDNSVRIPTGVFAAFVDIGYSDEDLFTIVWGETQRIELEPTTTGGTYTLTLDGQETAPITVSPSIFQSTANLLAGLEALPNVEPGDVKVTNRGETPGNPFIWDVQFSGQFSNMDVATMIGDFDDLSNGQGSSEITERFPPDPLNANTFRSSWSAPDLYADSVTAWPWQSEKDGDQTADEFDEVGGVQGNTTFPALRNPPIDPALEYSVLQADFIADATGDLVFTNNLAEMIASYVLVYGTNTPIPEALIDFGDPLTVTIIQPVNAEDDTFPLPPPDDEEIFEDTTVQLDVLANDFLADVATGPLSIDPNGFTGPANGSVSVVVDLVLGDLVEYTPNPEFFGIDTFTYTAVDINGDSDTAQVTVTVTNVNDVPIANDDGVFNVDEDSEFVDNVFSVVSNDDVGQPNEIPVDTLTIFDFTQPANGTVRVVGGGTQFEYMPTGEYFGADSFTYRVFDGTDVSLQSATVEINVENVNDLPIANDDGVFNVDEDSAFVDNVFSVVSNDDVGQPNEIPVDTLTISDFTQPAHGTVRVVGGGTQFEYMPTGEYFGADSFTYRVFDGTDVSLQSATVEINVENVNDPPVAVDDDEFVEEFSIDNPLDVLSNDRAGPAGPVGLEMDDLTIIGLGPGNDLSITTPTGGTATVAADGKSISYTPPNEFADDINGPDVFTYTIQEDTLDLFTSTATVSVVVDPITRPRARDDSFGDNDPAGDVVLEDSDFDDNVFDVMANDLFNTGATQRELVSYTEPLHGDLMETADGKLKYKPDSNYFGPDSFEYIIDDELGEPDTGVVTILVTNVNDVPIASDDGVFNVDEDSEFVDNVFSVVSNDDVGQPNEIQLDTLTIFDFTQPAHGSVRVVGGGTQFEYMPTGNYFGADSFTYRVFDGTDVSLQSATVGINVENVNDRPVANDDGVFDVDEDSDFADNNLQVLSNDDVGQPNEIPLDTLTVFDFTPASHGTVRIGGGGTIIQYEPEGDYFGPDSFTYRVFDGTDVSLQSATVQINVENVNDAPVAEDDDALALAGFVDQEIKGVLDNDSVGPDNEIPFDTLTILGLGPNVDNVITTDQGGTAKLIGQQIFYTPADGFVDDFDTFTYTIDDGNGGTSEEQEPPPVITVEVVDAVPSDISGKSYLDVNNNGQWDPQELVLGGVEVTLEGVNIRGEQISETVQTGPDGVFVFRNVLPNEVGDPDGYALRAATPEYARDGSDAMIDTNVDTDYNPGTAYNDEFRSIELGLFGTDRAENNYMFGERGLSTQFISLSQYLSSTRTGLIAATTMAGDDYWFSLMKGWEGAHSVHVQLANDLMTADLTIVDGAGQSHTETISYRDYHLAGDQNTGEYMVYFNGSAADFGFVLDPGDLAQADVPAEGEVPMDAEQLEMLAARGQRDFEKAVDVLFGGDHLA